MPCFTCEICCREFVRKDYLQKHLQRKFKCNPMEFIKNRKRITKNHQESPRITKNHQESPSLVLATKDAPCEYCGNIISKRLLNRHQRNNCKKIPQYIKKKLLEKYNCNKKHIKALEVSKIVNSNNSTVNSHNTTNNITNNNNITVKINPLGCENTDFLKKKDIIKIINRCYMAIPDLIMKIHDRPENKNFFIPNFNKKDMAFLNKEHEIEYNDYDNICETIISKNIERLDSYFYKFETELTKHIKERMKTVMKENDNEELNEKYMKNIKYYLMNISKKNKIALTKFIENIEKQIQNKKI